MSTCGLAQVKEFFLYALLGIQIGLVFDFFRGLRKTIKTKELATNIEDFIFLIFSGAIIVFGIIRFSDGVLRFYIFFGIILGIAVYILTISKFCIIIFSEFANIFKKIANKFIKFAKKAWIFFRNIV